MGNMSEVGNEGGQTSVTVVDGEEGVLGLVLGWLLGDLGRFRRMLGQVGDGTMGIFHR